MSDFEYSNGACGCCLGCGEATDEPWHAFCSDCWREQDGWRRSDRNALAAQHEEREAASRLRLIERVGTLERQLGELGELVASLASRLELVEMQGPVEARRAGG
jgi:hypothetical protein